jgi:hypothetical protein
MKPFLFVLLIAAIGGSYWLCTSQQSPLVASLGIGVDGDFKREAQWQINSLVDRREDAYCASANQRNRHEWTGRLQNTRAHVLDNDPQYDAEGIVGYWVFRKDGSTDNCEDVFRRLKSTGKWEFVTDSLRGTTTTPGSNVETSTQVATLHGRCGITMRAGNVQFCNQMDVVPSAVEGSGGGSGFQLYPACLICSSWLSFLNASK